MAVKASFRDTIRRMFLRYAFVPISLLFILFILFTAVSSNNVTMHQTKQAGDYIQSQLAAVFHAYASELDGMASSPDVIQLITSLTNRQNVFEQFYEFNNHQSVRSIIHILDRNGELIASSALNISNSAEQALDGIVTRLSRTDADVLAESNRIPYSHSLFTSYTFAKKVWNEGEVAGFVVYQLMERDFEELIFAQSNEIAIVTDQHQYIIATTSNVVRGLMNKLTLEFVGSNAMIEGAKYYAYRTSVPEGPWNIYTLNSLHQQDDLFVSLAIFFVLASILLWFVIQYLAGRISSRQTRSVYELISAVNQLQAGNMNVYVDIRSGDEFELLGHQYNVMLRSLNELQTRNEELSNLRRVAEMKQLQAQFQPHFIFNVLETLRYAIVVNSKMAQEIVIILSRLLRYSIHSEQTTVRLKEDLHYISDYLRLHEMRFKEKLTYSLEVDEKAEAALVPRLMLQPVIENSIKYGYRSKERLHITITGTVEGMNLVITVEDNGGGMSAQRLQEVRSVLEGADNHTEHIGLHNLHRRLRLMYGGTYGVKVYSVDGEGTIVRLVTPYHQEG